MAMRLFHFSDNPAIDVFEPRPVLVPSQRAPGLDWLNGPLMWAIEQRVEFMYLFSRDCPRILLWATDETCDADKAKWLQGHRAVAFVERAWLADLQAASVWRYELPPQDFDDLGDAGMWVSRQAVTPLGCETLRALPLELARRDVDLRVVDSLAPLKSLWGTTLHVSGIRLRNARDWA